jgi:hypothetical protein
MKFYKYDPKTLQYKNVTYIKNIFKYSLILAFISIFLGVSTSKQPIKYEYITDTENILLVDELDTFTEEKLILKIKELNLPYPHITLAQAKLESGEFSSRIFKENHNLFGMKQARVRINLAKGTQYGHAYYDDWVESVLDYSFWYASYARKCKSEKELFHLLDQQYAEANQYVSSLKRIISKQQLEEKFK